MPSFDSIKHWESIYQTKELNEVSWYEPTPQTSLNFLNQFNIPKTAKIIDIGGGDSYFVDHLLDLGYCDITVLDISESAINRAKARLGDRAERVNWIVQDVTKFKPAEIFDFWHDRAAFHFLTDETELSTYLKTASNSLSSKGIVVIGTFSENGPKRCSGLEIKQYSEVTMPDRLKEYFRKIDCTSIDHKTPFDTIQKFVFCSFQKKLKSAE